MLSIIIVAQKHTNGNKFDIEYVKELQEKKNVFPSDEGSHIARIITKKF